MTHYKRRLRGPIVALMSAALALTLAACDSGKDQAEDSAADTAAEAPAEADAASTATAEAALDPAASTINVPLDDSGVPIGALEVGDPDAELEIIEYVSVTCGHCAQHHVLTWPDLRAKYVATGKVRTTFRFFARNPYDEVASMLPLCARGEQSYSIMDLLLSRQQQWMVGEPKEVVDNLAALVRRAGMSRSAFDECVRNSPGLLENIRATTQHGIDEDDVQGTPTFVIGSSNFSGAMPLEHFVEVIEGEL